MVRTGTVDFGDELHYFTESCDYRKENEMIHKSLSILREKQAESRLQVLRDLLAEGLSSGEPVAWDKDAFLKKVKAGTRTADENR